MIFLSSVANPNLQFPEQITEARKCIKYTFKKSCGALVARENYLLARVDDIGCEYVTVKSESWSKLRAILTFDHIILVKIRVARGPKFETQARPAARIFITFQPAARKKPAQIFSSLLKRNCLYICKRLKYLELKISLERCGVFVKIC